MNPPSKASLTEKYEIKSSTLFRRARDITTSKAITDSNKSLLSKQQQLTLITYVNKLCDNKLASTTVMIRNFAEEFTKKRPGRNWVSRFNQTHNAVLSSKYLAGVD